MPEFDIVIPKKELARLLERVHGIADKKSALPALANVLLTASGGVLHVAATDLYLAMSGCATAETIESGSIAVPAKDLFERIKCMPDGPVQITADKNAHVTIKAVGGARRYSLPGLPGTEFPPLPKPDPDAAVLELPAETLSLLMARTHFSISVDETRPHVNSALFEWQGPLVRMVSTDGHRLSKMEMTSGADVPNVSMLIPLKAIGALRHLVDSAKGTVTIRRSGPCAFFDVAGMQFSVKLVDATFPPYEQVVPKSVSQSVWVPRLAFADALKAVQLASSDRTGGVTIKIVPGVLRITSESPESGQGFDEVTVDYTGPEMTIGMNAAYPLATLGCIDSDDVIIGVSGELDPMLITPAIEPPGSSYLAVQMPMRLS